MTEDEARAAISEFLNCTKRNGRVPMAAKHGTSYMAGFSDGEFVYWLGESISGYRTAIMYMKRRLSKL